MCISPYWYGALKGALALPGAYLPFALFHGGFAEGDKNQAMKTKIALIALIAANFLLPVVRAEDENENPWEKRVAATADSIVFVKFVLKIQMTAGGQSRDGERSREVLGVVVDEKGLIMSSNSHFDPAAALPPQMRGQVEVKGTPADIKVIFGSEEEEYEAQIVARDSVLDLAFVQILDLKGRKIKPVDLRAGSEPVLGQELYGISRMGRGFDCTPVVARLFVSAVVTKPRKMWGASGQVPSPGLPVFNYDRIPVGIVSLQQASAGVEGQGARRRPFLLPLTDVLKSFEMATKRAAEALEAALDDDEEDAEEGAGEPEDGDEEISEETPEAGE